MIALTDIESVIRDNPQEPASARTLLRQWLFSQAEDEGAKGSVADAIALLSEQPSHHRQAAIVLVRCLAIRDLIPEANAQNQLVRHIVTLCAAAIPEILDYLKIEKKSQSYEKFERLLTAHKTICELVQPLRTSPGDLDALLTAQRRILGNLNHSIARIYLEPFGLNEVKKLVEVVTGRLRKVHSLEASLLVDAEECQSAIAEAKETSQSIGTFLSSDYLDPFLSHAEVALDSFLHTIRGRFTTRIERSGTASRELQKRYPLYEPEREVEIVVPMRNTGPGMATNLQISAATEESEIILANHTIALGNVLPGDFSVTLDVMVVAPIEKFHGILEVTWGEIGNPNRKDALLEFEVLTQSSKVDWQSLEYWTPYSTEVAEGDQFVGRTEKLRLLASKLLRSPMEPFYVTGQKRVGKTSLVKAVADFSVEKAANHTLSYHYILWGAVAHSDASTSMKQLGEGIEEFIFETLPNSFVIEKRSYDGSLSGLVQVAEAARKLSPDKKLVIVLDEFDEIHQELYMRGNLAETFFANLRALSRCKNVCVVLVGGENMPFIMDRQGQKLNNFFRFNLDYYSREDEWQDFQLLVTQPTSQVINWHEDAIGEIFNVTNGNPYFAKIVCAATVRYAIEERDADITQKEIRRAVESEVSVLGANSFAHLWQDGIPVALEEREPDVLRRMRVLLTAARTLRKQQTLSLASLVDNKGGIPVSDTEIRLVVDDLIRREVLEEKDGALDFVLPIFRLWLVDVGARQLVADSMRQELAKAMLDEENDARILSEEIVSLAKGWPPYRGMHIGTDAIRSWCEQVENPRDQRCLFRILQKLRFYSEALVRSKLREAYDLLRPELPEFVQRRRNQMRSDVLMTYVDGAGKSGASYASMFAEENRLPARNIIERSAFPAMYSEHVRRNGAASMVVVIDDIAATGKSLERNLKEFFQTNGSILEGVKVRVVSLISTGIARDLLADLDFTPNDFAFRACELIGDEAFAFPASGAGWPSEDSYLRARSLCTDLGSRIYRDNPLGYGGLGLLVVLPTTVPNNTLPILHSSSTAQSGKRWSPLFPRPVN
ncbi:MAG: ATP-binding protein [Tistlia sp.]|uniref:phosphoribosyltransferase-like protein n=1 Tax=Tistlia sp. TaxID=3057121 RepID=UPI0034A521C5